MFRKDLASGDRSVDFLQGDDVGIEIGSDFAQRAKVGLGTLQFVRHVARDVSIPIARRRVARQTRGGQFAELAGCDQPLEIPGGHTQGGTAGGIRGEQGKQQDGQSAGVTHTANYSMLGSSLPQLEIGYGS